MSLPHFSLDGKVALVTGARRGVGKGIALKFAKAGANVAMCDLNLPDLEKVAEEIQALGRSSLPIQADTSVKADVERMVEKILKEFGTINILVNNAGIIIRKDLFDHTEEDWDKTMNVNLKSVFLCCKQVVPVMIKQGKGKIINIASGVGQIGMRRGVYGASKAGVINLTASMALELAPYKINVNAISPGIVETPMSAPIRELPGMKDKMLSRIPYGRLAQPEDIASAALFLASDESDYIVGSLVMVDGGLLTTFEY